MKLRKKARDKEETIPVIPIREQVIFPSTIVPLYIGRPDSRRTIDHALSFDRKVVLAFQTDKETETPGISELYPIGTLCNVMQVLKIPDGTMRILVEGQKRVELIERFEKNDVTFIHCKTLSSESNISRRTRSLMLALKESFIDYVRYQKKISEETVNQIRKADTPDALIGQICNALSFPIAKKMEYLSSFEDEKRLEELAVAVEVEMEVISFKRGISSKVQKRIDKNQREFILNEHLKEINKELGKNPEPASEANELSVRVEVKNLPRSVRTKVEKELRRLESLQPFTPEAGVLRGYIEWICDLPWGELSEDTVSMTAAEAILERDHYSLKKAKERILEYIAVRTLNPNIKGAILCFVGPPGTGKTSLGRSVAKALNRPFTRISLGGVRDEAEIRGHRKTYVGALPGKFIQTLSKMETSDPLILLDEIDKMSHDFRGDPASALLEVLDPEQNSTFTDHYLEVPFDLSKVIFITTANSTENIPYPLLDRMEMITIPGYSEFEKLEIANHFIMPKQLRENGLDEGSIILEEEALLLLIHSYTMESGVRGLEREIARVIRKVIREKEREIEKRPGNWIRPSAMLHLNQKLFTGTPSFIEPRSIASLIKSLTINATKTKQLLGSPSYEIHPFSRKPIPGLAIGMAWTETGGRILPVEAVLIDGAGDIKLTGKLGEVMKESAQIAHSFIRANASELQTEVDKLKDRDLHIHVPEGAIPKDGPSAGIVIATALLSAMREQPAIPNLSLTGEITLTGRLLPVGGIKEKLLAAHRNKISTVILPKKNENDIEELPEEVKESMQFIFTESVKEALLHALP